jgi:hypothetical protein
MRTSCPTLFIFEEEGFAFPLTQSYIRSLLIFRENRNGDNDFGSF